jgi:hypothetical protein
MFPHNTDSLRPWSWVMGTLLDSQLTWSHHNRWPWSQPTWVQSQLEDMMEENPGKLPSCSESHRPLQGEAVVSVTPSWEAGEEHRG